MSDNEGFESQADTERSTDSEDIAEQKSVVQPYQFEPVAVVTKRNRQRRHSS